jgi:hypothetical protein
MSIKYLKSRFSQPIRDDLAKSGLTESDAAKMGWHEDGAGDLVIPYNNGSGFARKRLSYPRRVMKNGKPSLQRYSQPRGTKPELFLPSLGGVAWDKVKTDTSRRLIITEGEKKAAAACKVGLACIGLGGVECWASKGGVPLEDWHTFDFDGREVWIVFDSDIVDKPPVRSAARRLANMLVSRGGVVSMVALPSDDTEKSGLDDFLVANGLGEGNAKAAKAAFGALPVTIVPRIPKIDDLVDELNAVFSVVSVNGQALIQQEVVEADATKTTQYLKLADFNLLMRNRFAFASDGKIVQAAFAWLSHPKRREYSRVVFEPGGAPATDYNLWQGLSVMPVAGDCDLILQHIRNVICSGDDDAYRYLIAWCADMLQTPANRPGVAIVIKGEEGVGKGIFANMLKRMVAPHSVQITQGQQVTGRFNSILKAKLFVFMDEAFWAGDKQGESVLKGLITESELVIELKGKEPIRVSNYARILMASNNDWVVPAGHGARRYLVLDASDAFKGNSQYFAKLVQHIETGGLEAFADCLMHQDLSKVDLRKPPKTKALLEQKLESMESTDRYIFDRLMDGANGDGLEWQRTVIIDRFYERYLAAASQVGGHYRADKNRLGKRLIKILHVERDRQMVNGQRHYVWVFPSLEVCRLRFAKYMEADDMAWPEACSAVTAANDSTPKSRKW